MTYVGKAALGRITIDELEIDIEASVDVNGALELNDVRAGLSKVAITLHVRSDADGEALDELGRTTTCTSGVFDSLASPVPINLAVERLP